MDESIRIRCIAIGDYMVGHEATVRQAAQAFGLSKSSVHKDMTDRLPQADPALYRKVQKLLRHNKAVCHLRGGDATRRRWAMERARKALQT